MVGAKISEQKYPNLKVSFYGLKHSGWTPKAIDIFLDDHNVYAKNHTIIAALP